MRIVLTVWIGAVELAIGDGGVAQRDLICDRSCFVKPIGAVKSVLRHLAYATVLGWTT